ERERELEEHSASAGEQDGSLQQEASRLDQLQAELAAREAGLAERLGEVELAEAGQAETGLELEERRTSLDAREEMLRVTTERLAKLRVEVAAKRADLERDQSSSTERIATLQARESEVAEARALLDR